MGAGEGGDAAEVGGVRVDGAGVCAGMGEGGEVGKGENGGEIAGKGWNDRTPSPLVGG